MIVKGWIHPSVSLYGTPIVFVHKKTGELCMCVDFWALNSKIQLDVFPLPYISDLLDWLGHATVFSSINLDYTY